MSSDGDSFSYVSFHVGADWMVRTSTYPDQVPILTVDAGRGAVAITVKGKSADQAAVEFARTLVREAQAFATEVERIHALAEAGDGDGEADAAA